MVKVKNREASVLFSGGSDSTLAAALLLKAKRFKKLHLLTFHHSAMKYLDKSEVNVRLLKKMYGKDKIVYRLINIEDIFHRLYYSNYFQDLRRYGVFLAAGTCNVCQLAMHVATVLYNLQNGIFYAYDGYKKEKEHVYVIMSTEGIEIMKKFYDKYGITYENPVLNILRTDWELYELGITTKKNVKFPYEHLDYRAQHSCYQGLLTNLYILGYNHNLFHRTKSDWLEYLKEKVELARNFINTYLAEREKLSLSRFSG